MQCFENLLNSWFIRTSNCYTNGPATVFFPPLHPSGIAVINSTILDMSTWKLIPLCWVVLTLIKACIGLQPSHCWRLLMIFWSCLALVWIGIWAIQSVEKTALAQICFDLQPCTHWFDQQWTNPEMGHSWWPEMAHIWLSVGPVFSGTLVYWRYTHTYAGPLSTALRIVSAMLHRQRLALHL